MILKSFNHHKIDGLLFGISVSNELHCFDDHKYSGWTLIREIFFENQAMSRNVVKTQ